MLSKIFPLSFKFKDGVANLIIGILIYLVAGFIGGVAIGIAGSINLPLLGTLCRILGGLLDLYVLAGIVIQILAFFNVVKE